MSTDSTATSSATVATDAGASATTGVREFTGAELYFGRCLPCHGPDAAGGPFGPEIRHPHRPYGLWIVRNGRPGVGFPKSEMLAYTEDELTDDDVEKIWDWLDEFPDPTTGADLYLDHCGNCHGHDAAGGPVESDLRATTFEDNLAWVRSGAGGTDYGARLSYMPAWDESSLSDADIAAIVEFWSTR